ncbi:MAG: 4Fe-4S binding protein [Dehalococcoidales bacterium]|nr:4Fe-4S binding protein [Dehalococcoidales bacterium]
MNVVVDRDLCTGCGTCVDVCPLDNLRLDDEGFAREGYDECWYCNACEVDCPEGAIRLVLPFLVR